MLIGVSIYAALAATYGNFAQVALEIQRFPLLLLLGAFFLASLNYAFRYWRWEYYLGLLEIQIPWGPSLGIFMSGFALTVTPGKVGEVLKSYLIREAYGVPMVRTAPIVIAERLTDLIALLLLALLGVSSWMGRGEVWLTLLGFGLCGVLIAVLTSQRLAHGCIDLVARLPPRRKTVPLCAKLHTFYDAAAILVHPGALLVGTVLSLFAWACECVAFYVILRGFHGVEAPLLLSTFIYSMMTVAGALAFVPGGLGVTEGGMAVLLTKLAGGMSQSVAVAATLLIRLATLWFAVLLGVVALLLLKRIQRMQVNLDQMAGQKATPT